VSEANGSLSEEGVIGVPPALLYSDVDVPGEGEMSTYGWEDREKKKCVQSCVGACMCVYVYIYIYMHVCVYVCM
jgi:hypothetical protein